MADGPTIAGTGGVLLERVGEIQHAPSVTSVAIDPRGRYLLTGGPLGARIWWAASGEPVRAMKQGSRGRAVFAAGGRLVVATGPTLWDVETGDRVSSPDGPAVEEVLCADAHGARVLTKNGGSLTMWAMPSLEKLWTIGRREDRSSFRDDFDEGAEDGDEDGQPMVSAGDGEQEIYRIHSAQLHANDERLVTAGYVGGSAAPPVVDRSAADGRVVQRFTVEREVFSLAIDGGADAGERALLGGFPDARSRTLRIVSLTSGARDPRSAGPPATTQGSYVIAIAPVPASTLAVVADRDGEMTVLDLREGGGRILSTRAHDGWVSSLAFLPDGRLVSAGGYDGFVRFWRLTLPPAPPG